MYDQGKKPVLKAAELYATPRDVGPSKHGISIFSHLDFSSFLDQVRYPIVMYFIVDFTQQFSFKMFSHFSNCPNVSVGTRLWVILKAKFVSAALAPSTLLLWPLLQMTVLPLTRGKRS